MRNRFGKFPDRFFYFNFATMIQYTFSSANAAQQYIQITVEFQTNASQHTLQLPSWRPGRYELGNFAKNVKSFKIFNQAGKLIPSHKTTKDTWVFHCLEDEKIKIEYQYYAAELNAGSTFLNREQLYVNPVNCCIYIVGKEDETCEIKLNIPEHYETATSLRQESNVLFAANFEELADSPWICSAMLQHNSYIVRDTTFHIWFNGEAKIDWERILKDFNAFTTQQVEKFTEFPVDAFHFLFQIVPSKAYHGVEHLRSTVIQLGPSYDIFGSWYKELLGVSSHELYHAWNVKSIRPIEMFPYDYTKENYSRLGYLCEGVTTYMGDLQLFKSGVFNFDQYADEFSNQLQKHFDNFARFQCSVAEASFDTWLDGYVPGAPNRKVSIYTEGCLLAFATDVFISKHSKGRCKLDDVMRSLYFDFYMKGKGVSEADYRTTVNHFATESMDEIFDDFFYGSKPFESLITNALDEIGLELIHEPSPRYSLSKLGFKSLPAGQNFVVKAIYPGSPAELGNLMLEDEIIAVNSYSCLGELDKWLAYFDLDPKTLTVLRKGQLHELLLPEVNRNFYLEYKIRKLENPNLPQRKAYEYWIK